MRKVYVMKVPKGIKLRKMQVYTHHSPRRTGKYSNDPQIRLCGKWLKKAGFEAGDQIRIITMNKCLVIVPDGDQQEDL